MANENSKTPTQAQPQMIPLSKIHDLPNVFNPKPQDKTLGSMVLSIESSGVKEAVILRQRSDGEYELLSGYRRRRASELAKKQDIPAHVYEMTMQEAIAYRKAVKQNPNAPIPGKLVVPNADKDKAFAVPSEKPKEDKAPAAPGEKPKEDKAPAAPGDKPKEDKAPAAPGEKPKEDKAPAAPDEKPKEDKAPAAPGEKPKEDKAPAAPGEKPKEDKTPAAPGDKPKEDKAPAAPGEKPKEDKAPAAPGDKAKEGEKPAAPGDKAKEGEKPAAPGDKAKEGEKPAAPGDKAKEGEKPAAPGDKGKQNEAPAAEKHTPTVAELEAQVKAGERISLSDLAAATHAEREAQKGGAAQAKAPGGDKADQPSQGKEKNEALTAAIEGPAGTSITQIFDKRLDPPDEAARKSLPTPGEGESYFITLHPAYLEKSIFNTFSVDTESENFKELMKSVELVGIKDPVLARFNSEGKLEILSGQRRHLAATMLNYGVPTIIQKIDDADAKIIVADGNLHRDKISSYDLSRALRMKMEGMKQKAGRRKKGFSASELQSDAKLAQEMGMSIAKLNRMIHLSEAVKGICDLVDDNKLSVSVASEIAYLKPKTQESVLHLLDLGYKATNERVSRMKKAEAGGTKLDEMTLRSILDDKDIAPKQPEPVKQPEAPAAPTAGTEQPPIPASPDVPAAPDAPPTEDVPPWEEPEKGITQEQGGAQPAPGTPVPGNPVPGAAEPEQEDDPLKGPQERPEVTKVILTGDRLRKYFPDVSMTPREIEESVYSALEERRQRQLKEQQKATIFKRGGPTR